MPSLLITPCPTLGCHLLHRHPQLVRHEPDDPEDDESGEEAGEAVTAAHHDGVPEHVVLELVVAGEGDHAAPGDPQGEEDLDAGVGPDLRAGVEQEGGQGAAAAGWAPSDPRPTSRQPPPRDNMEIIRWPGTEVGKHKRGKNIWTGSFVLSWKLHLRFV